MSEHNRDLRAAWFTLLLAVFVFWTSLRLPMRGDFIESPGIFPMLMSGMLFLFALAYLARSWARGGRVRPGELFRALPPFLASERHRPLLLGILFPAVYVFIGVPLIGFYVSSALFMTVMFFVYVKKWRWGAIFLWVALAVTVCLYLVFDKLFMLQIW